jgi:hypothetical protein
MSQIPHACKNMHTKVTCCDRSVVSTSMQTHDDVSAQRTHRYTSLALTVAVTAYLYSRLLLILAATLYTHIYGHIVRSALREEDLFSRSSLVAKSLDMKGIDHERGNCGRSSKACVEKSKGAAYGHG